MISRLRSLRPLAETKETEKNRHWKRQVTAFYLMITWAEMPVWQRFPSPEKRNVLYIWREKRWGGENKGLIHFSWWWWCWSLSHIRGIPRNTIVDLKNELIDLWALTERNMTANLAGDADFLWLVKGHEAQLTSFHLNVIQQSRSQLPNNQLTNSGTG